jgi:hypothetical protein
MTQTCQAQTHSPTTFLARRTLLAASVAMLGLAASAQAQSPAPLVDLKVIDRETGEAARVWRHAGRLYVAGRPGARYSLQVTNNTGGRVLAVMSVDGVNILTGETAGYDQRGYVFAPYETYQIKGWRKSDSEIAAFNFAPLAASYAARTGRPDDVGVIGVAAFRERAITPIPVSPPPLSPPMAYDQRRRGMEDRAAPPPLPIPPVERRVETPAPSSIVPQSSTRAQAEVAASAAPRMAPRPAAPKLGTGHGQREWSTITTVPFTRATSAPQYVYRLEYDSRERLIASGVIPRPRPIPVGPRPFPANPNGYVPDPPYGG